MLHHCGDRNLQLEISPRGERALPFGDLLRVIEPFAKDLAFVIQHVWVVGNLPGGERVLDFESRVESDVGYACSWSRLVELATADVDWIELHFLGTRNVAGVRRTSPAEDATSIEPLRVDLGDDGLYTIFCRDPHLASSLVAELNAKQV